MITDSCAGIGCKKEPAFEMRVVVLDMIGSFCEECALRLKARGLAEKVDA